MINNLPTYAQNFQYVVARIVDNELWFWGAYNNYNKACEVAAEIGGKVIKMK